jgi:ABC-2 type transport system ATP-binding protein
VLELQGLSKRYGETVALDGLSFTVDGGQLFGFVGPNGAGKTTAMRIVIGVLDADAGQVLWRDAPLDPITRRRFGYMPEERGLYPKMTVADQLAYFAELHGGTEPEARAAADLWIDRLGLTERADDEVEKLSLGNQQRVQLGVALVHEPVALVLDEPFSGLDPVGVDVLADVLVGVARERGVPVIFSSHQLELVERLCDAVAIVSGGRLVDSGKVGELRRRNAGNRYRLDVVGAESDSWARLEGVRSLGDGLFELDANADPQRLLDAGRAAGRVARFGPELPTLAELFRDVVAHGKTTE